jgi:hypothetical protein
MFLLFQALGAFKEWYRQVNACNEASILPEVWAGICLMKYYILLV